MSERKKRYSQKRALTGAQTCKLWPKSNNTTNVLRPRRFKWFDLFQNVIALCARHFLLVKCFSPSVTSVIKYVSSYRKM